MFTTSCFIRKNTSDLRKNLEKLGYAQAQNGHGGWFIPINKLSCLETFNEYNCYMGRSGLWDTSIIDCGDNETLFLALAALRDDTDYMQWFFSTGWTDFEGNTLPDKWVLCDQDTLEKFAFVNNSPNSYKTGWKKATVEELIQHFK